MKKVPLPPPPELDWVPKTLKDIREEMSRNYTMTRHGMMEVAEMSKYIYALREMSTTIKLEHDMSTGENNSTTLADFVQAMKDSQIGG